MSRSHTVDDQERLENDRHSVLRPRRLRRDLRRDLCWQRPRRLFCWRWPHLPAQPRALQVLPNNTELQCAPRAPAPLAPSPPVVCVQATSDLTRPRPAAPRAIGALTAFIATAAEIESTPQKNSHFVKVPCQYKYIYILKYAVLVHVLLVRWNNVVLDFLMSSLRMHA